ncbi:MAG: aldo/keto reductase [Planctomycetales bacterium]|nr:aldo/keto reductase [Planctomycetales bacterium]
MRSIDRRLFLGTSAGVAAGLTGMTQLQSAESPAAAPPAPPLVPLGNTGIQLSRLGQGTGVRGSNRQSDQTRMGYEKLVPLFRHAYDRGIRFFDLADLYGSHVYFREALKTMARDEVAILTKIWWRYDGPTDESTPPWRKQVALTTIERFLHEIDTDYLDVVLLHCLQKADWQQELQPYMEALDEAKQKGQVRAVGVSCHDLGALETAAESPWVDVILARINPGGVKMDGTQEEILGVLRRAKKNGKAVLGMKIFGEGQLVDQREACIQFAQESGVLDAMTIGFDTPAQIDEVLELIHRHPAKQLA